MIIGGSMRFGADFKAQGATEIAGGRQLPVGVVYRGELHD